MMTDKPLTFAIFGNSFQPRKSTSLLRVLSFLKSRGERVMFDREFYDFLTSEHMLDLTGVDVFDGDDFRSAEIGHVSMVIGGKPCYCGQRGCVNAYCSSDNLSDGGNIGLDRFFRELDAMDPGCLSKWDAYLDYLAIAIKNIRMLYDCDVIIGGEVGRYIPKYIPELTHRVHALDSFHRGGDCILPCKYRSKSSAVGAALIHIDRFIENV